MFAVTQLVFLRIMWVFGLEHKVPPLVINFWISLRLFCHCILWRLSLFYFVARLWWQFSRFARFRGFPGWKWKLVRDCCKLSFLSPTPCCRVSPHVTLVRVIFTISAKWRACLQASLVQANTHGSYWRDCQHSCLREVVAHGGSTVFCLKFDRPPQNEHCSKDQGEETEVYETSESSPRIAASASSRKKKLSFVLDSDSEEDCKADAR